MSNLGEITVLREKLCKLSSEEIEIKEKYNLSLEEIMKFREEANEIIIGGDMEIYRLLGIPIDNPFKCEDAYLRVFDYVAGLSKMR